MSEKEVKLEMMGKIIDYVMVDVDSPPTPEQVLNYIENSLYFRLHVSKRV